MSISPLLIPLVILCSRIRSRGKHEVRENGRQYNIIYRCDAIVFITVLDRGELQTCDASKKYYMKQEKLSIYWSLSNLIMSLGAKL